MALMQRAQKLETDQGDWFKLANDPDSGEEVFLRIRRIPQATVQKIESKYGYEKDVSSEVETAEGRKASAFFRQRVHSGDDIVAIVRDKAVVAWVDSRGLRFRPLDDEAAGYATKLLGVTVETKQEVSLDGRLTPDLKNYILADDHTLAQWIVERALKLGERDYAKEVALSKA